MNFILFISLIVFSQNSLFNNFKTHMLRSVEKLDASPTEKCLVQDENGISYVKKCKKGKYCNIFENSGVIEGVCVNFLLPLFVDDTCTSNEECLSQNCDNGKCKEPDNCFNDLQCDYGKYCDIHNPNDKTYKCKDLKEQDKDCYSNEECGKFMLCNYNKTDDKGNAIGICTKIASVVTDNEACVVIDGVKECDSELNKFLCENGQIYNNKCLKLENDEISCEDNYCKINDENDEYKFECKFNPIANNYYCPYSNAQKNVFQKYKNEIVEQYKKYENDDIMWNWNNNKLHADDKDLKELLFYAENPFFAKYNTEIGSGKEDDEDAIKVIEFLQQLSLSSNWIILSLKKYFFILCLLSF